MNASREQSALRILGGEARGIGPSVLRAILWIAERIYIIAICSRNWLYDRGIRKQHRLARRVVSVGNITTGGTGKTPAVQWIARHLLSAGHRPACLLRGYAHGNANSSDEAALLAQSLQIPIGVNSNRVAEGQRLLRDHPEIDVILLDDGFQHRRVQRDLDIVLIDATNPFGFDHVLPRGLLREPLGGLWRAGLIVLTRCDQVGAAKIENVSNRIRTYNSTAQILRAHHHITQFRCDDRIHPAEEIRHPVFIFCGIGNPASFQRQLVTMGATEVGHQFLDDHHAYTAEEIAKLGARANAAGAKMMVTTEKDWVKIEKLNLVVLPLPIYVAELEFSLSAEDSEQFMAQLLATPAPSRV